MKTPLFIEHGMTSEFCLGEIAVSYRVDIDHPRQRITCSRDAYYALMRYWSDDIAYREEFCILCLNRSNEVMAFYRVSVGGTAGTVADQKMIFGAALAAHASSIILAHNHPSGNLTPSQADKDLTKKLRECGQLLDCPVLDHCIVTPQNAYLSFADEGLL